MVNTILTISNTLMLFLHQLGSTHLLSKQLQVFCQIKRRSMTSVETPLYFSRDSTFMSFDLSTKILTSNWVMIYLVISDMVFIEIHADFFCQICQTVAVKIISFKLLLTLHCEYWIESVYSSDCMSIAGNTVRLQI